MSLSCIHVCLSLITLHRYYNLFLIYCTNELELSFNVRYNEPVTLMCVCGSLPISLYLPYTRHVPGTWYVHADTRQGTLDGHTDIALLLDSCNSSSGMVYDVFFQTVGGNNIKSSC